MLITFEGIDGVGKSTQSRLLYDYLSKIYGSERVVLTREPGGTSLNESLRELIIKLKNYETDDIAEMLIFIAMRREHFVKVIQPNLLSRKIVICDRFVDSTVAYQGYGCDIDLKLIKQLNSWILGNMYPDITLIIDCDIDQSLKRAKKTKYESMGVEFYRKVREGFKKIANENPQRCHIIVNSGKKGSITNVHREVLSLAEHAIKKSSFE